MSIEPQCIYCNAHDKFRCKTQPEADKCASYVRRMARLERVRRPEPKVEKVTIAEIDAAIETLTKLKRQLGDPDD